MDVMMLPFRSFSCKYLSQASKYLDRKICCKCPDHSRCPVSFLMNMDPGATNAESSSVNIGSMGYTSRVIPV
jgi:hypothetical protein